MPMPGASHNFEHLGEIRNSHDKCFDHSLFDFLERLSSDYGPLKLFFLQVVRNWGHDSAESLYESPVECRQPMKTSSGIFLGSSHSVIAWIF